MKRGLSPSVSKNLNQVQNSKPYQSQAAQVVKKQSEYKNKYRELEQIGKGTSGTVFLVKSKQDKKFYIAKKIILTNLNEQERQAVEQELILLKKLKHPHIVGYKENFLEPYYMIIIMEYCEQGDLSFHIKQKLKENDHFPENIILNWFIQLTMALDFIHEKHVLHRDVKSSNIFLTSSGSIKLGDFGISKVLHSTADKAQTLIGTPYYLSPEVCENKPYTYQSDIWALGCVLFEMCALKHPFVSESLMALVVKIIREPNPNIPNMYSSDLNCLVQILLAKKPESRPRTKQILSFPFVNEAMKDFISSKGLKDELKNLPIKKTQLHIKKEQKINQEKEQQPSSIKQIQRKNSLQNQAQKQANIKAQPQQNVQKHQEQQKSVGSTKINRKNSNDIKKMEELIQKQMKEVQSEVQKKLVEIKGSNNKKPNTSNLQDQKSPSNPSLSKPSSASSQSSTAHQTPQRQNDQKIKQSPSRQIQPKIEEKHTKQSPQIMTKNKVETHNKQSPQSQIAQKQVGTPQNISKNPSSGVLSNESKTSNSSKNSSRVIDEDDYDKKYQEMMNKVKQEYEQIKKESPNPKKSPTINNQKVASSSSASQNNQKQNNLIHPQKASSNQNYQPTPTQLNQGVVSAQSQQRYNTNYSKNNFEMTQIEEDIQIKNIPDNQAEKVQTNINLQDSSKKQNFHFSQKGQNNSLLQDSNVSFNLSLTNDSVFNNTAFKSNLPKKQSTIITSGGKEQIIEEIIENEEAQEHENIKSQAPSDVSEYKNEFLNSEFIKSNKSDDASKYQTVISEHIQTQMMPQIPTQNIQKNNQEEINDFQDDDLDFESLPQREDYLDSEEDNEYEEDFEVSSEEGDSKNEQKENNDFRLTRKNLDKELDEVIEMYKSQLLNNSGQEEYNKFKHMLNMSEIAEASVEYSSGEVSKKMMIPAAQKQQKSNFTKK
ncbi:plant dual-specificity MAP kinase kinase family domain protein (macronuclear) [Tetrahymena thermophila SB210]|uniref:non-specific serine/threonine protein kinase n=1 Tax=Tetrahymena thermophila (strain SB210) TaxID=312017 RepID=I7MM17_TETTS|nr:plant dual-specificity MAP kinase kinase family domain protein [Tetrahymena thermophila SB210]EAS03793.1 plant dual-specificity MAP kinase kinase family domain protein [Tetrahymena thermophila SB210]|eukprot:XP_001024038.1 plant dual-specificity MAP kinase kinase family domain protein [Tetrahymena thermophila SB210]